MESPLSFNSTENFRKKLLLKNLKPYKVDGSFVSNEDPNRQEINIVDYSVIDSESIDNIGNRQENLLYLKNIYGPTQFNSSYGDPVNINANQQTITNLGVYGYTKAINSRLGEIGNQKELDLIVLNNYKPGSIDGSFGDTKWSINDNYTIDTNGSGYYDFFDSIGSKLEFTGDDKRNILFPMNQYGPQSPFGLSSVSIGDNFQSRPNEGEYTTSDSVGSLLEIESDQIRPTLFPLNSFGPSTVPNTSVNINDLESVTPNLGEYLATPSSANGSKLEIEGNNQEIILRTKNKYTPNSGNDYGITRDDINDLLGTITNTGEYDYTDSIGSDLQFIGNTERITLFPINQYGPETQQSPEFEYTVNINVNYQSNSNEGEYSLADSDGSPLEVDGVSERNVLFPLNQYGPENGQSINAVVPNINNQTNSNEGNYSTSDSIGSQLETIGLTEANDAYIINKYVPGDGSYEIVATIPELQVLTTGQKYYNSSESFVFVPSTYNPVNILTSEDPSGSNGSLSQDSTLAQLGAKQLQKEFKFRVATELLSQTIGRVNALDSTIDPISGGVSVKPNLDPFNAVGIISGNIPLLQRNYQITSPDLIIGKAINFAAKLAGLYSPYSIIPDEYFDYPKPRLLNQLIENPVALAATTVMGAIRSITSANIRRGSDLMLAYTSPATRDLLWGQIFYNEYRPDYRGNSLRNPNLFSPDPNYYVGTRKTTISDITSPVKDLPEYKNGKPLDMNVYDFTEVSKDFEGEKIAKVPFGISTRSFSDGSAPIMGDFTWTTRDSYFQPGVQLGVNGEKGLGSAEINQTLEIGFNKSISYDGRITKEGSLLDITQKIVDAGARKGVKTFQHVGNAINQVAKVFNDGYTEMTKGSKVIRYTTKNSLNQNGEGVVKGFEYARVFTKDRPYYSFSDLQKVDGNIRKSTYSVLDNTYNLNIAPLNDNKGQSTNIQADASGKAKAKKYMFSLENLAWRTSAKVGFTYDDLPACERGPNGGRIMWFPPYDLTFDDTSKADFTAVDFIGRPEQVYTYKNSSRSGNLTWTILVDHPSISNLLIDKELKDVTPESEINKIMASFFAGALKYDIYELSKRFPELSPNAIQKTINAVKSVEDAKKVSEEIPKNNPDGQSTVDNSISELNDNNKEVILYFADQDPKTDDENYQNLYNTYIGNNSYIDQNKDIVFSYDDDTDIINNNTAEIDLETYVDTRINSISDFFDTSVKESLNSLNTFLEKVGKALDSGAEVKFTLVGVASSVGSNSSNRELSKRRIESIKNYISEYKYNNTAFKKYIENKSLDIKDKPLGDSGNDVNDANLSKINCDKKFKNETQEGIYSLQAMACRRVKITNVKAKPGKNKKDNQEKPESSLPNTEASEQSTTPVATTPQSVTNSQTAIQNPNVQGATKELIRRLLTECNYFDMIQDTDPFLFDSIKKRLKHFQPAFHSITPEGLNSRLTFLQQCMRPGDTIPTVKPSGSGTFEPINQDAFNSAFGSAPVLVLRIGDFFNTKIIPDNLSIKFENTTGMFDLNPEGIGVQPMFATISLSFKIIGGMGIAGPVSRLQNALSFNYYANTELYDERAEQTEDITSKYDAEFYNLLQEQKQVIPVVNTENQLGETIGDIVTSSGNPDGSQSGSTKYKKVMNEMTKNTTIYTNKIYETLKKIGDEHSIGGLYIMNTGRKYTNGNFNSLVTTPTPVEIYGKPNEYQNKIDLLFSKFKDDVENNTTPLLSGVDLPTWDFKSIQKNKIQRQIKKLADTKKSNYVTSINTNSNETNNTQLNLIKIVDRLNFVTKGRDGYFDKKGSPLILTTTGTTAENNTYANSLLEIEGDLNIIGGNINEYIGKLKEYKIITSGGTGYSRQEWSDDFIFDLSLAPVGEQTSAPENRLNMIFAKEIRTNPVDFVDKIVSEIDNDEDKTKWKNFLSFNLSFDRVTGQSTKATGIYNRYIDQKNDLDKRFQDFNDEYFNGKFNENYQTELNSKDRLLNFSSQNPLDQTDVSYLNSLKTNSSGDKYNLKQQFT